jgi:hypothetical protein
MQTLYFYDNGADYLRFQFDNPYYVAPPEPVERIEATAGAFSSTFVYVYFETTSDGQFLYGLVDKGSTSRNSGSDEWDVAYDPSDGKFYDIGKVTLINGVLMLTEMEYQYTRPLATCKRIFGIMAQVTT